MLSEKDSCALVPAMESADENEFYAE